MVSGEHLVSCSDITLSRLTGKFEGCINLHGSWWHSTVVTTSVYDQRTFPGLCHDVQLLGDLLGVNRPLYVSQHSQVSHSSFWVRQMSSELNSGRQAFVMHICVVALLGECLWVKADMVLFACHIV